MEVVVTLLWILAVLCIFAVALAVGIVIPSEIEKWVRENDCQE